VISIEVNAEYAAFARELVTTGVMQAVTRGVLRRTPRSAERTRPR